MSLFESASVDFVRLSVGVSVLPRVHSIYYVLHQVLH